jgi:MSHA biogenesis protein MshI
MFNKFKFNKIFNKQVLIILLDKVIGQGKVLFNRFAHKAVGQAKVLFSRLANQQPEEIVPEGMLGVSVNNGIVALAHVVVRSLQDISVKSFGLFTMELVSLDEPNEDQKSVQNIIGKYIKDQNLQRVECCYVLSGSQYVLSLIEASVTNDNKAREKAILWGIKDYINYSIDDAILDSFEVPIVRTQDGVKLAYAVAMRAKVSEEIGNLINFAGAHLKYIDINELCLRNIMALYANMENGCLLLKLSEENNTILLVKNNALLISRNTKLDVKKLDGFDPNNNVADEKFSVAENLVLELQRSVDYGNSIFREVHFNSIYISPCNINLDLFIPWAKEQLGMSINRINLMEKIKFNQNISLQEQADCLLAIGAALRSIGKTHNVSAN